MFVNDSGFFLLNFADKFNPLNIAGMFREKNCIFKSKVVFQEMTMNGARANIQTTAHPSDVSKNVTGQFRKSSDILFCAIFKKFFSF